MGKCNERIAIIAMSAKIAIHHRSRSVPLPFLAVLAILAMAFLGCGYHTAGHAVRLPENLRTIAIPGFVNKTQTYRIEQVLTRDVVREFIGRTSYQILNSSSDEA